MLEAKFEDPANSKQRTSSEVHETRVTQSTICAASSQGPVSTDPLEGPTRNDLPAGPIVAVFSLKECPHCKRAKALLDDLGIPYEDISLSDYPEKRKDMLELADRLTVPQIFVRGHHVGGADDLEKKCRSGGLQALNELTPTPLANDPRLRRPEYSPKPLEIPDAPAEPIICLGGTCVQYSDLVDTLIAGVEVKDRAGLLGMKKTKMCFKGSDMTAFLQSKFNLKSKEEAVQGGQQLLRCCVFSAADGSPRGFSNDGALFRFQAHTQGMWTALNTMRKWCPPDGCISEGSSNPTGLLKRLKGQLSTVVGHHTNSAGMVNYIQIASDPGFAAYENACCELQSINLATLDPQCRKSFVINMYNTIIPHAFTKVGIPTTDLARVAFFDGVIYNFAELAYSLNDLENGILRGNRSAPFHLRKPFSKDDPRKECALQADHRIHFALNCGAKSCPPVKWFTTDALDEELRIVAMAWVEQDENVRVDTVSRTLLLSKICKWYSEDFGENKKQICAALLQHSRGKKREQMESLLEGNFSLKHMNYDWSTNSECAKDYSETCLSCFFS